MAIEPEQKVQSTGLNLEQQVFLLRVDNLITELGQRVSSTRCLSEPSQNTPSISPMATKLSDKISKTIVNDATVNEMERLELGTDLIKTQKGKNRWPIYTTFSRHLAKVCGFYALGVAGAVASLSETAAIRSSGHTTEAVLYGFITFSTSILSLMLANKEVFGWSKDSLDQEIQKALSPDNGQNL